MLGLNSDDHKAPREPAAFSPSCNSRHLPDPSASLEASCRACLEAPPTHPWMERAKLPRTERPLQRSPCASLNGRLCLMAIILFSAADVSPPFLNLDCSATFAPWAVPVQTDLRSTQQRACACSNAGRWEQGGVGSGALIYFDGLFLQVFTQVP